MTKTTQIFLESESPTLKLDIAQYLVKQKKTTCCEGSLNAQVF